MNFLDLLLSDNENSRLTVSLPTPLVNALYMAINLHNAQLDDRDDYISNDDVIRIALQKYMIESVFSIREETPPIKRPTFEWTLDKPPHRSPTGRRQLRS